MTTPTGTSVSTLIGRIDTTNRIAAQTAPTAAATRKGSVQLPPLIDLFDYPPRRRIDTRFSAHVPRGEQGLYTGARACSEQSRLRHRLLCLYASLLPGSGSVFVKSYPGALLL